MADLNRSDTNKLLVALRHPLRRQLLLEMSKQEKISPRDLAGRVEQPLSNVSYHVRVLAQCGAASLLSTSPARGSMQHFYCATVEAPWARQMLGLEKPKRGPEGETPTEPET